VALAVESMLLAGDRLPSVSLPAPPVRTRRNRPRRGSRAERLLELSL
jgi:hypothetical protein